MLLKIFSNPWLEYSVTLYEHADHSKGAYASVGTAAPYFAVQQPQSRLLRIFKLTS